QTGSDGLDGKDGSDGVNGVDGENGVDGKDGFGFDDIVVTQLTDKQLQIVFEKDGRKKEFLIDMPLVVDTGVYKSGKSYSKGDGVTYGGSFWIAQVKQPNQAPGKGNEWRLAVKKGRDAREI
ncbi:collagen-like protein, partial [Candidatus Woesebacteria bacterium]